MRENKYHIQAIRKELEACARYSKWKQFRLKFESLSLGQRESVVDFKLAHGNSKSRKASQRPLLHTLCSSMDSKAPCPVDVMESVIQSSQHLLRLQPTPLSVAVEHQTPGACIQCLLKHEEKDTTTNRKSSLSMADENGDTPLLQAVRSSATGFETVRLLVKADESRTTLLIASRKRNRVPLYYVASEELAYLDSDMGAELFPKELSFMLLQTRLALEGNERTVDTRTQDGCDYDGLEANLAELISATIVCGHLMNERHTTKLLRFLLPKLPISCVDTTQNPILHQLCFAKHEFLEPCISIETVHQLNLLEYVLQKIPESSLHPNFKGLLPIHIALKTGKSPAFLRKLIQAAPDCLQIQSQQGQLALHLAILFHPELVQEIWQLYPEGGLLLDQKHMLFPFQLAAIPKTHPADAKRSNSEILHDLTSSFLLLRASPNVLGCFR